jgi:hypothetical protein
VGPRAAAGELAQEQGRLDRAGPRPAAVPDIGQVGDGGFQRIAVVVGQRHPPDRFPGVRAGRQQRAGEPVVGGVQGTQAQEGQPVRTATEPDGDRGDLPRLAGRLAGREHAGGRAAEIGIQARRSGVLEGDHDVRSAAGGAGQRGKVGSQRDAAGRGSRGQPEVNGQG